MGVLDGWKDGTRERLLGETENSHRELSRDADTKLPQSVTDRHDTHTRHAAKRTAPATAPTGHRTHSVHANVEVKDAMHKRRSAEDGHGQSLGLPVGNDFLCQTVPDIELDAVRAGRHRANPLSARGPVRLIIRRSANGARPIQFFVVLDQTGGDKFTCCCFYCDLVVQEHEARPGEHERTGVVIQSDQPASVSSRLFAVSTAS